MRCSKCQAEVAENAAFCSQCGLKMGDSSAGASPPDPEPKSKSVSKTASEKFSQATASREGIEEETLWEGTYSGKAMLGSYLLGGLITVGLLVLCIYVQKPWLWWVAFGVFLVVWMYISYGYAKNRFGVRYRLTSHRFFHETGILLHKTDLIEVIDIDDITFTRTILDRLTGVGTIHIDSSDRSHPQISIPGIDNVEEVARLFQDTRHEERRRRAIHIESV